MISAKLPTDNRERKVKHGRQGIWRTARTRQQRETPTFMTERSTLLKTADSIIRRVLADADSNMDLANALNKAYPFGDDPEGRQVWLEALIRVALKNDNSEAE